MTDNFTDRNKSVKQSNATGGRVIRMNWENGYGGVDYSKIMDGTGSATYDSQPKLADPINYSGKENFTESKYAGGDGQSRINASGNSDKDDIETSGGGGDDLNRRAY